MSNDKPFWKCEKCGFTEERKEEPLGEKKGRTFKPLVRECPKCGSHECYIHNIKFV